MRVAARLTGVSPERMRAWEARHGAIRPSRTPGGSRRYSLADLDRLRLLREAIEAGYRIGELAPLDLDGLRACVPASAPGVDARFGPILTAFERLDSRTARRLLLEQLAELGTLAFARECVLGMSEEIGQRWERGELSVATEHLATNLFRSMLTEALAEEQPIALGPRIVFATPGGERHDLGVLAAALVARDADAVPIFLGADVPEDELVRSVRDARADVLALGFVMSSPEEMEAQVRRLRRAIPESIAIWLGGAAAQHCPPVRGVDRVVELEQLTAFVLEAAGAQGALKDRGSLETPTAEEPG